MKLPLTANSAHGLQPKYLRPFQKLNQQLVDVMGHGLCQPVCSIHLQSGRSLNNLRRILGYVKYILVFEG